MKRLLIYMFLMCSVICLRSQVLSLDSCLILAKKNNAQIANAELEIEKAKQVRYQTLTKYFPNIRLQALGFHALNPLIDIGTQDLINGISNEDVRSKLNQIYQNYGQDKGLEELFDFMQYGITAGAVAVQPVFAGGQIVNANRLAKVGIEAARLQARITEREVRQEVEQMYLLLAGLETKRATLQSVFGLLDTLTVNVNTAIQAGLTTRNDLLKIELQRSETERQQLQLETGMMLARQALCTQIGIPYSDSLSTDNNVVFNVIADSLPRPERELLDLNVRSEQLKKKMAVGKTLPQIAVGGTYSYNRFFKDKNQHNGLLFAMVQIPLTEWWGTGHHIKEISIETEQAENDRHYLTEQMELQSVQAQQQVLLAEKQISVAKKTIDSAAENLRIVKINYDAGLMPLSDLLEAQTLLIKAETDLIDARLQLYLAQRRAEDYK